MDISDIIITNIDNIFKENYSLQNLYKSISGSGDKQIDEWDAKSSDQIKKTSGSAVRIIPRIKSKNQRDWLRGELYKKINSNWDSIISNIGNFLPNSVYDYELKEEKITGTGLLSLTITATEENKNRPSLRIAFQSKGLSGSVKKDPHELMTAILILLQKKIDVQRINLMPDSKKMSEFKKIVDELYKNANKIVGAVGLDGFYTDAQKENPDLVNLAKAISVSNYAIDLIGSGKVSNVWQTGTVWANEIKKFNVGPKTIQKYNSSDIIVKFKTSGTDAATHYWGLSLKKGGLDFVEPTLLNKPAYGAKGFLTKSIPPAENAKIEKAKLDFFKGAIKIKLKSTTYNNKKIDSMTSKEILKLADTIFTDKKEKSEMLRGQGNFKKNPNIYFKEMDSVFKSTFNNNPKFFQEFLDIVFKINLQSYMSDNSFHFSLITGFGDYKKGKLIVEKPKEKEGRTVTEIFRKMFSDPDHTSYRIVDTKQYDSKKINAFESGSTAAKLFYVMEIGKPGKAVSIVDLEVRYKGSLTSEPQFQVFMSVRQNSFANLYKKIASESKIKRW